MQNGKLAGGDVAHALGQQLRFRRFAVQIEMRLCPAEDPDAVQGGPHDDADAVGAGKPGLQDRLLRRGVGILRIRLHVKDEARGHEVLRMELPHLRSAVDGQGRRVDLPDLADAAHAAHKTVPIGRDADADGRYRAYAGDDDRFTHRGHRRSSGRPGRRCGRRSRGTRRAPRQIPASAPRAERS